MRKKEFKTDLYDLEVYEDGRVFNKTLNNEQPIQKLNTGHLCISVKLNNKFISLLIHRLVYTLFVGDIEKGFIVHHKDGDKYNNSVDNLQLMTQSDHARLHQQKYFDKIMVCPICGKEFLWTALQQNRFYSHKSCKKQIVKHSLNVPFCSKSCQGKYGTQVQKTFNDCKMPYKSVKTENKIICRNSVSELIFNNRNEAIQFLVDKGFTNSVVSADSGIRKCLRGKSKTSFGFEWILV